jgi:hypothetical protein
MLYCFGTTGNRVLIPLGSPALPGFLLSSHSPSSFRTFLFAKATERTWLSASEQFL